MDTETTVVQNEPRIVLHLPDLGNIEEVRSFLSRLEKMDHRGVTTLYKNITKALDHFNLTQRFLNAAQTNCNTIAGIRSVTQRSGDKKKSARSIAKHFYESLSTSMLRRQCVVFGLDYDSYNTMEEIITALVDAHLEQV